MSRRNDKMLVIIGASARAVAFSAIRAGFAPHCADLFADEDLRRRAPAKRIGDFGSDILQALQSVPVAPWMYTGALENHPAVVERLARKRPLYGNPADVLRHVRDLRQWTKSLADAGLRAPPWKLAPDGLPCNGTWLRKKLRASGGRHVTRWTAKSRAGKPDARYYFQQYVEGTPVSALYVAAARSARLLGVTRQLTGCSWCAARGFTYAGSLGPLRLRPDHLETFTSIGARLAEQFQLAGLFGVDAVMADDGIHTLEINPRYTASVEVLERALGIHAIKMHVAACTRRELPDAILPAAKAVFGKAILYARRAATVPPRFVEPLLHDCDDDGWPRFADIPAVGTCLRAGQPVLSVFARQPNWSDLESTLRERVAAVEECLYRF